MTELKDQTAVITALHLAREHIRAIINHPPADSPLDAHYLTGYKVGCLAAISIIAGMLYQLEPDHD